MAKARPSPESIAACTTRRLKVWRRLLVVMKPKRAMRPCAVSAAARLHQYMTKSALSGTSGQVARSAPLLEEAASQWWTDSLVFVVTLNRGMLTARMAGQPLQVTQLRLVGALFAQLAAKAKEVSSLAPTTRQE